MKNKLLLLILQVSDLGHLFSCAQAEQQESALPTEPSTPIAPTIMRGENAEYLDRGSVLINGKLPLTTSVQNINELLGKPDSIHTIDWDGCTFDYRSKDSKIAYYGDYVFEQFGDSLDFMDVTFGKSKEVFLQSNDLRLDASTTLEEIKRHYPNSVKSPYMVTMSDLGQVQQISLSNSKPI